MSIRVESITKSWGNFTALRDISLEVNDHELLALLGPSGSGKTTLLRIVAGLETADRGEIFLHDENATHHHVRNRRIGFVFQHYAIFRHMTVFENIAFGLRVRPRRDRPGEKEIRERVHELLNLVHIEQFANRKPSQLSGGQRQRVALARALAVQPKVLLLDEPFGALDARVRQELRGWLRNLQKELGITTVMVTHDQEEAMEVADRIVIMNEGRIEQAGSPNELWEHPANAFVFDFLGSSNLYHGHVRSGFIELPGWKMRSNGWPEGGEVDVGVRTFDVRIAPSRNGSGRVKRLISSGEFVRLEIELPQEKRLLAQIHKCDPSLVGVSEGTAIRVEPLKAFVFHDQVTMGVHTTVH